MNDAHGSGLNEQKTGSCLFSRETNRSISGLKLRVLRALVNSSGLSIHSDLGNENA